MSENLKASYPYPEALFDDEGYPTQEALDYIKNWCAGFEMVEEESGEQVYVVGQYFTDADKVQDLIDYVQSLWAYNDAIKQNENYLEIHTYGWSGNEEIVEVLRKTNLWHRLDMTLSGGHYYFKMNREDHFMRVLDYKLKERLSNFIRWTMKNADTIDENLSPEALAELYLNRKPDGSND